MHQRRFQQVDVFTPVPYQGNPLAVVLDGADLGDAELQRFANWTNLSETTFLLPPSAAGRAAGADYRVRIFDPVSELRFAGHPTLGSCHAWLQAGGQPQRPDRVVQECQVGLVQIRRVGQRLLFAAPPLQRSAPSPMLLAQVEAALGLKPQHILAAQTLDNGLPWLGILLDSPQTVLQLQPNHQALKQIGVTVGVAAVYADAPSPQLEVRAFAAAVDVPEDPVTGSLNASLAQWLIAEGYAPTQYLATQGRCLGRNGQVHIERDAEGQVWVGGASVTCVDGTVQL
ncbi:PhzF family phenazine biosynthesis protein [Rhodoferax ferrireducens]|uniref:PhzF family phenazine biosynthesis protein n=1 Tax=Rhodoferax ferrireducens TaxID=192843 RepID=A0ABU2CE20_9BURK|nr:PhzF family phenazine biosynthesis protein [Rhodoferax ferrireducens]MDR7379585.1 PhzF family phenazine biosynthesis protein [Rhodoferax ferrireducens]